ncbi:MFS transporter [Cupriavidus sp. AcVe19-1a]|nr:MFS transporter [Cupriavidus sp. AcVe19-1a]
MARKSDVIDVKRFIDEQKFSTFQWRVMIICFLIVAVDAYDAAAVSFVVPVLAEKWQVSKAMFGTVMSASVVGMALGAFLAGPIIERTTPKTVIVAAILTFGILSLGTCWADSPTSLGIWRLFTGIGIGAAIPGATTMVFEYAPERRSALLVNTLACGAMIGAAICGVTAGILIPMYGWQSVFVVGGVAPIVLAVLVLVALPEPLQFMALRGWPAERIASVLRRIAPSYSFEGVRFVLSEGRPVERKAGVSIILSRRLRIGTLMLWLGYFSGAFSYYLLFVWMPTLLSEAGATLRQATMATSLLSFGGVLGAVSAGWFMDRFNKSCVVALAFTIGAVAVWTIEQQISNQTALAVSLLIAGVGVSGAIFSMSSLAASYYPASVRSTGIATMVGIGRIGGMVGPIAGGLLMHTASGSGSYFAVVTASALISAMALLVMYRRGSANAHSGSAAVGRGSLEAE